MHDIRLLGCRPQPLMSYLKALGVMRLLGEQYDAGVRGAWLDDVFILRTNVDVDELLSFFLNKYEPTPIVAPWAGGCGFFEKDNKEAVAQIASSDTPRLKAYREVIQMVRAILAEEGQKQKPSEIKKIHLIRRYRRDLPDSFVNWIDCALVLRSSGQSFAPIMGTGGNDGRLDFTQNFMQRLLDLGMTEKKESQKNASDELRIRWLRNALFSESCEGLIASAIGQFDPSGVGGPNATQDMERSSLVNPWDYVLMIEGVITMAGSISRKMGLQQSDKAAFPFTVNASPAGHESIRSKDSSTSRAEIWLPLWRKFATFAELKMAFSEGRVELKGRQSRDGVEIARSLASLGADRGFSEFVRFGFLKRSGKSYLAVPVCRFHVSPKPFVDLLGELQSMNWLDHFRRACRAKNPDPPPRFASALRCLDDAVFDYCRQGDRTSFSAIFRALGRIEKELAVLSGKVGKFKIRPVPLLSSKWLEASNDGSVEFRLAMSLASIVGVKSTIGPLRNNLEPVQTKGRRLVWAEKSRSVTWTENSLSKNLANIMERRLLEAYKEGLDEPPLRAIRSVSINDIAMFVDGRTDDDIIEDFIWGAILVKQDQNWPIFSVHDIGDSNHLPLSRSYALCKLLFLPKGRALKSQSDGKQVSPVISIINLLRSRQVERSMLVAARRLRASGFMPLPGPLPGGRMRSTERYGTTDPIRLAASLLIPFTDVAYLKRLVLRPLETTSLIGFH